VVSGCYASLEPEQAAATLGVDLLVPNVDKDRLAEIADKELALGAMPNLAIEDDESSLLMRGRQRAFIKVQDGCRYRCTYCIVTEARGDERSRPAQDVIDEINGHHQQGIREVVLTGVHIGGYGSDNGESLYQLIQSVLANTDVPRLRIGSVEPWDLGDNFWSLFDNPRFQPHLHLPLQSGSDTVLRRMARRCKTEEFRSLVEQARAQVKDFNVTSDIIVGFPGETDHEWRETMAYVESIGFAHLHIFPFSARAGAKAARLPNPVAPPVKKQRVGELHELAQRMKRQTLARFVGRRFPVLLENCVRQDDKAHKLWYGYTPNFLHVSTPVNSEQAMQNRIVEAYIEGITDSGDALLAATFEPG
jgi:threonylcarbamoyladenosine tRNA methylthiotransferase MtaB